MKPEYIEKSKLMLVKALAIIGFLATIALLCFAAVQAVRLLPDAFASLASLAESLREESGTTLTLTPQKNIVNNGEAFNLSWNHLGVEGTYLLSYTCTEGISVDVAGLGDELLKMDCGESISLPETVESLTVTIHAERQRFTDVPFSIAFEGENEELREDSTEITVVNAAIPEGNLFSELEESENSASAIESEEEETAESVPTSEVPYTGLREETVETQNGFSDLELRLLGIDTDRNRISVRFSVQNIGTKLSESWSFSAALPAGAAYASDEQPPLGPQDRVDFTLGFSIFNADMQSADISVALSSSGEKITGNNSFKESVLIN